MARAFIFIEGNAGRDAEIRFSQTGKPWAKFSVAVTDRVKEGDEYIDGETTWYEVVAFNRLAEEAAECITTGTRVTVYGRFKLDKWTGDDGVERTTASVTADSLGIMPKLPGKGGATTRKSSSKAREQAVEAPW